MTTAMQLAQASIARVCDDRVIYESLIDLDGKCIVELGCGTAVNTRALATGGRERTVIAFEIDAIQHARNMAAARPPNLEFRYGGAEAIACPAAGVDVVFMFKSLHHVPGPALQDALAEIHRVLRPGGYLYVSEPIFAGAFNDILQLFHHEQRVRQAAFDALCRVVDAGLFELAAEEFFLAPANYRDFADFEQRVIKVTHTAHCLTPAVLAAVRKRFADHCGADGARFAAPMRVDLLRKPQR